MIVDPVSAVANAVAEVAKTVRVIAEGQPEKVREEMWTAWWEDIKEWRAVMKKLRDFAGGKLEE